MDPNLQFEKFCGKYKLEILLFLQKPLRSFKQIYKMNRYEFGGENNFSGYSMEVFFKASQRFLTVRVQVRDNSGFFCFVLFLFLFTLKGSRGE